MYLHRIEYDRNGSEVHSDVEFRIYTSNVEMSEVDEKETFTIPLEAPEEQMFEYMEIIYFILLALIIFGIGASVILVRLWLYSKGFRLNLLFIGIYNIASVICLILFVTATIMDSGLGGLWTDARTQDYFNQYQITAHPLEGGYFLLSAIILSLASAIMLAIITFSRRRKFYLQATHKRPYRPEWLSISGVICILIATILIFISFWNPWWSCEYNMPDQENDYDSLEWKCGPRSAQFSGNHEGFYLTPFYGSISSEVPTSTLGSDEKDNGEKYQVYDQEKNVMKFLEISLYCLISMSVLCLGMGLTSLNDKRFRPFLMRLCVICLVLITFVITAFTMAWPVASQIDMRESYDKLGYPVPEYSEAGFIKDFNGEFEHEYISAEWIDEYKEQPEAEGESDNLPSTFWVDYSWGGGLGYFFAVIAAFLYMTGILLFALSTPGFSRKCKEGIKRQLCRVTGRSTNRGRKKRACNHYSLAALVFIMITILFALVQGGVSSSVDDESPSLDDSVAGPYRRYHPVTSTSHYLNEFFDRSFDENVYYDQHEMVLHLNTGEKQIFSTIVRDEYSFRPEFNSGYIVYNIENTSTHKGNDIAVYDIEKKVYTKTIPNRRMFDICNNWIITRSHNDFGQQSNYSLTSIDSHEEKELFRDEDIHNLEIVEELSSIIYQSRSNQSYYIYNIAENHSMPLCSMNEDYRLMDSFVVDDYLAIAWRDSSCLIPSQRGKENQTSDLILKLFSIKDSFELNKILCDDNWECFTPLNRGILILDRDYSGFEFYNITTDTIEEWSIPYIYNDMNVYKAISFLEIPKGEFSYYRNVHSYDGTIYFIVRDIKMESVPYQYFAYNTRNVIKVPHRVPLIWELHPEHDTDGDGVKDIYDDDDDGDGVMDPEDRYPYDPSRSSTEYDDIDYFNLPPFDVIMLIVLTLLILGLYVINRKHLSGMKL